MKRHTYLTKKNINIEVIEIKDHKIKVNINNPSNGFIPGIMLEYDRYLKNCINSKVDVYYSEKKDLNKLRIKNLN